MPKIITTDTVWRAGETVTLTDQVQIAHGATLTIEPGAVVNGNGFGINIWGRLNAVGTTDARIVFNDVRFTFGQASNEPGAITIQHARLSGGQFLPATGNASFGSFNVSDSHLSGVQGFYIWYPTANSGFERNVFDTYAPLSIGVSGPRLLIKDNVFTENSAGIRVWANYSDSIVAETNTFLGTGRVVLGLDHGYTSAKLTSVGNYFGTTDPAVIAAMVQDRTDDLDYASVINWQPPASGPSAGARQALAASGLPIVVGTSGGETLSGTAASDTIYAGDGNDWISDSRGSDRIFAGAGDDNVWISRANGGAVETILLDAGAGADFVSYQNYNAGSASISLGAGDDRLAVWTVQTGGLNVTLGAGRDTLSLAALADINQNGTLAVSDFAGGAGGDKLDLVEFMSRALAGWDGSANPFGATGYFKLTQSGSATSLRLDRDGTQGAGNAVDLITFSNTAPGQFVPENLGGFAADGSVTPGRTVTGTAGSDSLEGGTGADVIAGLDGDDKINGNAGADRIEGGAGADSIQGGTGDDVVHGDDGADRIEDIGGSDTLRGGAGDDHVFISRGDNATTERVAIDTGGDNDTVIYQNYRAGSALINLGPGDDRVTLWTVQDGGTRLLLGLGRDTVAFQSLIDIHQNGQVVVADFAAGRQGDVLDFAEYYGRALQGWNGSDNPFGASGYLRLVQFDGGTVLQVDKDGAAGTTRRFEDLITFENAVATDITAENVGGFTPRAVSLADIVTASVTAPTSVAEDGAGSFSLSVVLANVAQANGTVTMSFAAAQSTAANGSDVSVPAYQGSYNVSQSPAGTYTIALPSISVLRDQVAEGTETVAITIRASGQVFDTGTDTKTVYVSLIDSGQTGGAGADKLTGTRFSDDLSGGGGDDRLTGGLGVDWIDGGAGRDTAVFGHRWAQAWLEREPAGVEVRGPDGTDHLTNVERFEFMDGVFTLDASSRGAQVQRLYAAVLDRQAGQAELEGWLDQLDEGGLTLGQTAAYFLQSPEFQAKGADVASNGAFVDFLYGEVLGRPADAAGRADWVSRLDAGLARSDALLFFSESDEHKGLTRSVTDQGYFETSDTAQKVALLYDSFLDRKPDAEGLAHWMGQIDSGTWSLSTVADLFADSPEFRNRTAGMNDAQLIDYMYGSTLNRTPVQAERDHWTGELARGLTKSEMLLYFATSPEHERLLAEHITGGVDVLL